MKGSDRTHLRVTRYTGQGVFMEDSEGNTKFMTADSYGVFEYDMCDGKVHVCVTGSQLKPAPGRGQRFNVDIFAPPDVTLLREELLNR